MPKQINVRKKFSDEILKSAAMLFPDNEIKQALAIRFALKVAQKKKVPSTDLLVLLKK